MSISLEVLTPNVTLIKVSGRLDQEQILPLEAAINDVLKADVDTVIVDMSDATYINSGGLRCLVTGWRKAKQQGGDLLLCGLNSRLQEIFSMVGFDKVFTICTNRESALEKSQSTN